jgi:hypothetical protein
MLLYENAVSIFLRAMAKFSIFIIAVSNSYSSDGDDSSSDTKRLVADLVRRITTLFPVDSFALQGGDCVAAPDPASRYISSIPVPDETEEFTPMTEEDILEGFQEEVPFRGLKAVSIVGSNFSRHVLEMFCEQERESRFPIEELGIYVGVFALPPYFGWSALISVDMPNVQVIAPRAFFDCGRLTHVFAPNTLQVGAESFSGCINLYSVNLPRALIVRNSAFFGCKRLAFLSIHSAREIGALAFSGCESLKAIDIQKARILGAGAFAGCDSLKYIAMPVVSEIGHDAFPLGLRLESVTMPVMAMSPFGACFCYRLRTLHFTCFSLTRFSQYVAMSELEINLRAVLANRGPFGSAYRLVERIDFRQPSANRPSCNLIIHNCGEDGHTVALEEGNGWRWSSDHASALK